jgi:DNA polymerase III epsilon subunit-like protein
MAKPRFPPVPISRKGVTFVYFDTETTGLSFDSEMVQLGAVSADTGEIFESHCVPIGPFHPKASLVNRFTLEDGRLHHRGILVQDAVSKTETVDRFMQYLATVTATTTPQKPSIVLVAHNAPFDAYFLMKGMTDTAVEAMARLPVLGFLDTLRMFRDLRPGLRSYRLEHLAAGGTRSVKRRESGPGHGGPNGGGGGGGGGDDANPFHSALYDATVLMELCCGDDKTIVGKTTLEDTTTNLAQYTLTLREGRCAYVGK